MEKRHPIQGFLGVLHRRVGRLALWAIPAFLTALLILWGAATLTTAHAARSNPNADNPDLSSMLPQPKPKLDRKLLAQLISEEKFEEAAKEAGRLREEAKT